AAKAPSAPAVAPPITFEPTRRSTLAPGAALPAITIDPSPSTRTTSKLGGTTATSAGTVLAGDSGWGAAGSAAGAVASGAAGVAGVPGAAAGSPAPGRRASLESASPASGRAAIVSGARLKSGSKA